jgi:hypothetical protein
MGFRSRLVSIFRRPAHRFAAENGDVAGRPFLAAFDRPYSGHVEATET